MGGFLPRFAVEVAFLGLLAAASALAELPAALIGAVMAAGWLITALIEWLAWRSQRLPDIPLSRPRPPTPGPAADWDLDELLAPLPGEEDKEGEARGETTRVVPPGEG